MWLVDTTHPPDWWRDLLGNTADNGTYFVVRIMESWASRKLNANVSKWLKSDKRSW